MDELSYTKDAKDKYELELQDLKKKFDLLNFQNTTLNDEVCDKEGVICFMKTDFLKCDFILVKLKNSSHLTVKIRITFYGEKMRLMLGFQLLCGRLYH